MADNGAMEGLKKQRTEAAWVCVNGWGPRERKEASATAQGLPVLLRTQGCAATLAVLVRWNSPLSEDLLAWLVHSTQRRAGTRGWPDSPIVLAEPTLDAFLDRFVRLSAEDARRVEAEALSFAALLKLYAKVLPDGGGRR